MDLKSHPRLGLKGLVKLCLSMGSKGVMQITVHVEDIAVTVSDVDEISRLKVFLKNELEIKDLGLLKYFLGIEVARSNTGIVISQRKYTLDLLAKTGKLGVKPTETPMEQNHGLHIGSGELLQIKRMY